MIARLAITSGMLVSALAAVALAQPAPPAGIVKLTDPQDDYPDVSPDGTEILFQSNRSGTWQLWRMRRDGSGLARWTTDNANHRQPAWSPNGRLVAFSSDAGQPAGTRAIFVTGSGPSDGAAKPRQLTRGGGQDVHPKWLPDGSRLLFNRIAAGGRQADVYSVTLSGVETRIELGSGMNTYASADRGGRRFVYRGTTAEPGPNGPADNSDIFIANLNGSGKRRLTTDSAFDGWPAISPDGRWIAFGSRSGGDRFRIFLMPTAGGGASEVPAPAGYNYTQPAWAPDGRSLIVYRWMQDRGGEFGQLVELPVGALPAAN